MGYAYYQFWETSFSNYIWVNGNGSFYNPRHINFEKDTNQPITVECYDYNRNYVGKVTTSSGYHWKQADLSWLPRGKSYRIKLVNAGSGTVRLRQGQVAHEDMIIA
ncbi:hypothetical protein MKY20_28535 [Cytobacillus sp. FSL W8-0315]|uniref:hypothetical protein n=1 Tax=Cytobacillus sp. FSL W8-0315 TaxID=2921600 RepID=UPI0030F77B8D